jgi:hypothetical protein
MRVLAMALLLLLPLTLIGGGMVLGFLALREAVATRSFLAEARPMQARVAAVTPETTGIGRRQITRWILHLQLGEAADAPPTQVLRIPQVNQDGTPAPDRLMTLPAPIQLRETTTVALLPLQPPPETGARLAVRHGPAETRIDDPLGVWGWTILPGLLALLPFWIGAWILRAILRLTALRPRR